MKYTLGIFSLAVAIFISACQSTPSKAPPSPNEQANALFEAFFAEWLSRSPNWQTWLGIKDDYDKWDDLSEEQELIRLQAAKNQLAQLRALDESKLSGQTKLSYELMERAIELDIERYQWRLHDYPVNQMFGWHTTVASVLINQHTVTNVEDAQDYIARINNVSTLFEQLIAALALSAENGIIPPKFVFPKVIEDSQNIIKGIPFDDGEPSPIFADFKKKVEKLELEAGKKQQLVQHAKQALLNQLKPAYEDLIAYLKELETQANDYAGVWKFPNGEAFYNYALKRTTTTDLSAEEIHQLGLDEVERIHNEMRALMGRVGFEGSLKDFFDYLKDDPQFYYPNNDEGRQAYLERSQEVIDEFTQHLDEAFITKPKSPLVVKRVEAFREKSAGKAFYQSPPPDGSRPGIYYANLYNMKEMPKYQLEALVYHEGLPGHHLQLSIASELSNLPRFRKHGGYTAYTEGWGLYSELLPKEMGFYQDPYSDFGRLSMELWRACRLVTDTGLHAKKWTREQAIQYLVDNTPNVERDARRAIERYIVMPSQATAYKIGMMKIVEQRERAKRELGDKFSLREYHELVLSNGAVPLNTLEALVSEWINSKI